MKPAHLSVALALFVLVSSSACAQSGSVSFAGWVVPAREDLIRQAGVSVSVRDYETEERHELSREQRVQLAEEAERTVNDLLSPAEHSETRWVEILLELP